MTADITAALHRAIEVERAAYAAKRAADYGQGKNVAGRDSKLKDATVTHQAAKAEVGRAAMLLQ